MTALEHASEYDLVAVAASVLSGDRQLAESGAFAAHSFIRLGGDSLRAMQLAAVALGRFSVGVSVSALLSDEPVSAVLSRATPARPGSVAAAAERVACCAPLNPVFVAFFTGPLRVELLRQSIEWTVERHEGLRTVLEVSTGGVRRRALAGFQPAVAIVDAGGTEAGFADFVRACAAERGRRPLDPSAGPPLRFVLVTRPPDRHALVVVAHHLLLDSWAVRLLLEEVAARYDAGERGALLELGATFGPDCLPARRLPPCALPARQTARLPFDAGGPVTGRVAEVAARLGITPFAFLLASFALALRSPLGSPLIAVPFAARPTVELRQVVAAAASLTLVPVDVDGQRTVGGYLVGVQRSIARSLANGGPAADRHPAACLDMHDRLVPRRLATASLDVTIEEGHGGGSPFDLTLFVRQSSPSFVGELEYATGVWSPARAQALLADHWATADALAADTQAPLPTA